MSVVYTLAIWWHIIKKVMALLTFIDRISLYVKIEML